MFNILAIDPAAKTGIAWKLRSNHSSPHFDGCASYDFSQKRDESRGFTLIRFERWLKQHIDDHKINIVIYERVSGRSIAAVCSHSRYIAIIERLCAQENIDYRAYSAAEIKKFATGKGNAGKDLMLETARTRWGYVGKNDNEADAIHLLKLAQSQL